MWFIMETKKGWGKQKVLFSILINMLITMDQIFGQQCFFKGCLLNCCWCHNPESRSFEIEQFQQKVRVDCRTLPITEKVGRFVSVDEVLQEIEKESLREFRRRYWAQWVFSFNVDNQVLFIYLVPQKIGQNLFMCSSIIESF